MPSPIPIPGPLTPVEPNTMLGIGGGATTDSSAQILRKHLNGLFKGKGWDSLIAALATGLDYNKQLLISALDQLFLSRASAKYLTQRASDVGVSRPGFKLNMSDDVFRKLATQTTASKITYRTINNVLEAFYGFIDTKANLRNTSASPYNLLGGETLSLKIDNTTVTVTFESNDFMTPGTVSGIEVAAVITRFLNKNANLGICILERDVVTDVDYLRIITNTVGLGGSVTVLGGTANAVLNFPTGTTTLNNNRNSAYAIRSGDGLDIILPVTSSAVSRNLDNGSYIHGNTPIEISSVTQDYTNLRVITTTGPHHLHAGEYVYVDNTVIQPFSISTSVSAYVNGGVDFTEASSILMSNGAYLLANVSGVTDAWTFDIVNGTFTQVDSTAVVHSRGAFVQLNDNDYLLVGGATATCEIYHLDSNTWTSVSDAPITLDAPLAFMLNGTVVVANNGLSGAQVDTFTYAPDTDVWTPTNSTTYIYNGNCLCRLPNNWIMAHGANAHSHTELYNPITDRWTIVGDATYSRQSGALCYYPNWGGNGCVYRFGGRDMGLAANTTDLERFDLDTGLWTDLGSSILAVATTKANAVLMPDNTILLVSGSVITNEIFNPETGIALVTEPLPIAVDYPQIYTILPPTGISNALNWNWTFLVVGGQNIYGYYHVNSKICGCGGFNGGPFKILSATPTSLVIDSLDRFAFLASATGGTVTSCSPDSNYPGPYLYEPKSGVAITGTVTTTTANYTTNILTVADTAGFPTGPAYLVFNYGKTNQIGPAKYVLKLSATSFLMDNSFSHNLPIGTTVNLLAQSSPWNPSASIYGTWLTASTESSVVASAWLDEAVAAGIPINKLFKYPSDRGLGNEGLLVGPKISDKFMVWGGDA